MNRYAICLAALLLTPVPASAESYRMMVNHGQGWSSGGDFRTLKECRVEAAAYAAKYSAQAGCAEVSLLEQWEYETQFQQVSGHCAARARVQIISKPGAKVDILGTEQQRFNFNKCMADNGHPLESSK